MSILAPHPRLERHLRMARMVLIWERAWPCMVPFLAIGAMFVGLSLAGIFDMLPPAGHITLLAVFAVAAFVALVLPWRRFSRPSRRAILHRIEDENRLPNHPLQSLEDHIGEHDDPLTSYLWQKQLGRYEAMLGDLRLPRPRPVIAAMDRYGLLVLPVLILATGLFARYDHAGEQLRKAFNPLSRLGTAQFDATLWVTPPAYTGQIPRLIRIGQADAGIDPFATAPAAKPGRTGALGSASASSRAQTPPQDHAITLSVPVGSTLSGSINSVWQPDLDAPDGPRPLRAGSSDSYVLETPLDQPGIWRVSVWGNDRVTLNVTLLADQPPRPSFVTPPSVTRRDHVRVDYIATDDYGLSGLELVMTPANDGVGDDVFGDVAPLVVDLANSDGVDTGITNAAGPAGTPDSNNDTARSTEKPAPNPDQPATGTNTATQTAQRPPAPVAIQASRPSPTRLEGPRFMDLAAHPWAGLPVNLQLVAHDNNGQTSRSDLRQIILPEREFNHPVARKLIAIRRGLLRHPERALEMRNAIAPVLRAPQAFGGQIGVYLALAVAETRLSSHLHDRNVHRNVAGLLWHIAEEIERGSYGQAERNLMAAEEKLLEALANPNITEAQIAELIENYRKALNEYMASLAQNMPQSTDGPPPAGAMIEQQDLSRIIDQIGSLMRAGARNQARDLLDRLRELVENMQVTPAGSANNMAAPLRDMLDGLRDLARRQQDLMRQGDTAQNAPGNGERARQQQGLANDARKLGTNPGYDQFGGISGLNEALRAMDSAAEALSRDRSHEALQQQGQAMGSLQRGIGELSRALEGLSQMSPLLEGLDGNGRRDPLGRPVGGDGVTTIPEVDTLERTWRILQELRRRSGDPDRPQIEQEFIDRLLKRF